MISFHKSTFQVSNAQREVQRILKHMTGLNVRPVPMPVQGGVTSTAYLFKCKHSNEVLREPPEARMEKQIMEIHDFQSYIKKLIAGDTEAGLGEVTIEIVPDPDDADNEILPCVRVRFCTITGTPHPDDKALAIAGRLESRLKEFAQQHTPKGTVAPLPIYQQKLRSRYTFEDAYAQKQ